MVLWFLQKLQLTLLEGGCSVAFWATMILTCIATKNQAAESRDMFIYTPTKTTWFWPPCTWKSFVLSHNLWTDDRRQDTLRMLTRSPKHFIKKKGQK